MDAVELGGIVEVFSVLGVVISLGTVVGSSDTTGSEVSTGACACFEVFADAAERDLDGFDLVVFLELALDRLLITSKASLAVPSKML